MNLSYWDREYNTHYDFIIIGAGIVGLTAAIYTKRLQPKARVLVLEQGIKPSGASTNNAGFVCYGSFTEVLSNIKTMGVEAAVEQVKNRWLGSHKLLELVGPKAIDYNKTGNYDLITENQLNLLDNLSLVNNTLKNVFMGEPFSITNKDLGFTDNIKSVVYNKYEGELNSGKLHRTLMDMAINDGIEFKFGTKVLSIDEEVNTDQMNFKYGSVAVCTNGYMSSLLPEYGIVPGRGQVIIHQGNFLGKLDAPCHYDDGFYYFRKVDSHRLMIGGGRNRNFAAETTTHLSNTNDTIDHLSWLVNHIFGDVYESGIEYSWSGIMGFSPNKKPIVEVVPNRNNVIIGFGCNGMGVALGAGIGKQVSELLSNGRYE